MNVMSHWFISLNSRSLEIHGNKIDAFFDRASWYIKEFHRNLHVVNTHVTHVITPNSICTEPPEDGRVTPETRRGIECNVCCRITAFMRRFLMPKLPLKKYSTFGLKKLTCYNVVEN
jgi:hypothetical protein